MYPENKLAEAGYTVQRPAVGKGVADSEHARKSEVRGANEELSRYFELPQGEREWTTPELLEKGVSAITRHLGVPLTRILFQCRAKSTIFQNRMPHRLVITGSKFDDGNSLLVS